MILDGLASLSQTNFAASCERSGSAFDQPTCKLETDEVATRRPGVEENRHLSFPTDQPASLLLPG